MNKEQIKKRINDKVDNGILERENANMILRLINMENVSYEEAYCLYQLISSNQSAGLCYNPKFKEIKADTIYYLKKDEEHSFVQDETKPMNKLILGDNYKALRNLLIAYKDMVDVIYIDPPYSKDNLNNGANTDYNNNLTRDDLLSMLHPRLELALDLLADDGVIYISIDDRNQSYIKCLMDEIFGEENFVANLPVVRNLKGKNDTYGFSNVHEYMLCYTKTFKGAKFSGLEMSEEEKQTYNLKDEHGMYKIGAALKRTGKDAPREKRPNCYYPIFITRDKRIIVTEDDEHPTGSGDTIAVYPLSNGREMSWLWEKEKVKNEPYNLVVKGSDLFPVIYKKQRLEVDGEERTKQMKSLLQNPKYDSSSGVSLLKSLFGNREKFDNPKPLQLIMDVIETVTKDKKNAIVLDFFAGSGTTGQAVMELNKKDGGNRTFILSTLKEDNGKNIGIEVCAERLVRTMTGKSYDNKAEFNWIKNNEQLGGNLEVCEIASIANNSQDIFDEIDETLYNIDKFDNVQDKINWVCDNFEYTQITCEEKCEG